MPYLKDCLDSVMNQSYTHWELLAIDDHSEDTSLEYLNAVARIDARITVQKNNGKGIIDALRLAYRNSSGSLITRMDADDMMTSDRLERMVAKLKTSGSAHIAVGQVRYFAEGGIKDGYRKYEKWLNQLIANGQCWLDLYRECVIPSPCWMVYRADFDRCGAFDSEIYPEDYDLCFRFYASGLKCIPEQKVLHHWRDYSHRTSRTDEHYRDNRFLDLKCFYFLKLHRQALRPLVLWGAGKKSKYIAKQLLDAELPFSWLCNNDKKINHNIYGVVLASTDTISQLSQPQVIIAVANPEEQKSIQLKLESQNLKYGVDFFFFC